MGKFFQFYSKHAKESVSLYICVNEKVSEYDWEGSGSVVECLTRDRRAAGSSLTDVTALCP